MNLKRLAKRALATLSLSMLCLIAFAQGHQISGTVIDGTGEPIIGANVLEVGTTNGVITDIDGNFKLSVQPNAKIQVSFIGYITQTVTVGSQKNIKVTLKEDAQALDEVVVVGYGTMKKTDVTGSLASVSADKLAARGALRVEDALQGSVPGVNITATNSRANGKFSMQIRGQSSINNSNGPLYVVDGMVVSSIDFLNSEDIERIDVLKDASSTAIYGSRASEGVILITTKGAGAGQSKAQPVEITYDGYYGIRKVARMPKFMESTEWMNYRFAKYTTSSGPDETGHIKYIIKDADLQSVFQNGTEWKESPLYTRWMNNESYDWADQVLQTGSQQNHFISASGASEKTSYRLGAGYQGEENVFKKNSYDRFNIKAAFDSKLSKVVEAGMSVNMVYDVQDDWITDSSNAYSPYNNAFWFAPVISPWDEDGNLLARPAKVGNMSLTSTPSPLVDLDIDAYENQTRKFHVFGNAYLRFNLMKGLKFTTTFSPNFYHGRQGIFMGTGVSDKYPDGTAYYQNKKQNYASVVNTDRMDWTWDNQIDFTKTWGNHRLGAMGLFSMYRTDKETYTQSVTDISDDRLSYHAMEKGAKNQATKSSYTESSMVSVAARLNYAYKERYMATVTVRADASSRFAKGNRWGWFPSAALAWRVSNEKFMAGTSDVINNLKLRLGWGSTGNQNVSDWAYMALLSSKTTPWGTGVLTANTANPDLKWETTTSYNVGLDLNLFDNRIEFIFDWYYKKTKDLLLQIPLPEYLGSYGQGAASNPWKNVGSLRNTGIEMTLNTVNIDKGGFQWRSNFVFSLNRNKVLKLDTESATIDKTFMTGSENNTVTRTVEGKPVGQFWGYKVIGRFEKAEDFYYKDKDGNVKPVALPEGSSIGEDKTWIGDYIFEDINGDGVINNSDCTFIGDPQPDFTYGIGNTFSYKGFDITICLSGREGNDILNYKRRDIEDVRVNSNLLKSAADYAQIGVIDPNLPDDDFRNLYVTNPSSRLPRLSASTTNANNRVSDLYVEDGSYIRLQNISLGYTLPKSFVRKLKLENVKVYMNLQNVYTWTNYSGYDPEVGSMYGDALLTGLDYGRYPSPRIYTFGLNISF